MTDDVARALEAVALRLGDARIPFLLGGSGLLHALGLPVAVRDIDLVVRAEERAAVEAATRDWWRAVETGPHGIFRSPWKAVLAVQAVEVDVIGGLAWVGADGRVVEMPFRAAGTWRCRSAEIPLAPPEHWLALYERYRPERAAQLAPLVTPEARARAESEAAG